MLYVRLKTILIFPRWLFRFYTLLQLIDQSGFRGLERLQQGGRRRRRRRGLRRRGPQRR